MTAPEINVAAAEVLRSDRPGWAVDAVHTDVDVHFGWQDRLKILFGWRVTGEVETPTEHLCGRAESRSLVRVWRLPRPPIGFVHTGDAVDASRE